MAEDDLVGYFFLWPLIWLDDMSAFQGAGEFSTQIYAFRPTTCIGLRTQHMRQDLVDPLHLGPNS